MSPSICLPILQDLKHLVMLFRKEKAADALHFLTLKWNQQEENQVDCMGTTVKSMYSVRANKTSPKMAPEWRLTGG
jgi:hypothetical protein